MKYQVILADPPWRSLWGSTGQRGGHFAPETHYETMATEDICNLPVKGLADKNCALALWATGPCFPDALAVLAAWGFAWKTILHVWVKTNPLSGTIVTGPGSYTRSSCEYLLLGMRGHVRRVSSKVVIPQTRLLPRKRHSEKPAEFRESLVTLFGNVPRIELFARQAAHGWHLFGNELQPDIDWAIQSRRQPPVSLFEDAL